ncbi:MAG: AAA family ATPase [Rickettsiales bacterium]|nr:AAA family ATPase [Rickettsiales bacterium]
MTKDYTKTNRVIFVNGPSSSGKTAIAKKLQDKLDSPYLYISIDKIIGMMPDKLNNWHGKKTEHGFWWHLSTDKQGNQLAEIQLGSFAHKISLLLKKIAITMLKSDHNIIIDDVCLTNDSFKQWKKILAPYKTIYIALKTSTKILEKREKERNNRMLGSARAQNITIHDGKKYDLEINTETTSIEVASQKIIRHLQSQL